jgi:hypothetical protein
VGYGIDGKIIGGLIPGSKKKLFVLQSLPERLWVPFCTLSIWYRVVRIAKANEELHQRTPKISQMTTFLLSALQRVSTTSVDIRRLQTAAD